MKPDLQIKMDYNIHMNKNHGFTLIELIVTLAVFGIVISMAAPSMSGFIDSNRRAAQVNTFVSALNLARSEAVKRNNNVTVCTRNDAGTACDATKNWDSGWLVFIDDNTRGVIDGSDAILRVYEQIYKREIPKDVTLKETVADSRYITYQARGQASFPLTTTTAASFERCDDGGPAQARAIMVTSTGRIRLSKDTSVDTDKIHEDNNGNIDCAP